MAAKCYSERPVTRNSSNSYDAAHVEGVRPRGEKVGTDARRNAAARVRDHRQPGV
jgi:hypothetical protein